MIVTVQANIIENFVYIMIFKMYVPVFESLVLQLVIW